MTSPLKPAIFLDRDGTINRDIHYLHKPEQLQLLPGVLPALRQLQERFALVVVTNQSAIARGLLTEAGLDIIHEKLRNLLAQGNVALQAIYYCPHHPDCGEAPYRCNCTCRKPQPGLFLRAASDLHLDLATSWAIGDKLRDCLGPMQLGCRGILIKTNDTDTFNTNQQYPHLTVVNNMTEATDYILGQAIAS